MDLPYFFPIKTFFLCASSLAAIAAMDLPWPWLIPYTWRFPWIIFISNDPTFQGLRILFCLLSTLSLYQVIPPNNSYADAYTLW